MMVINQDVVRHVPYATQCKETGRIYDERNCMIFKDEKEWEMHENGDNSVGERMKCLFNPKIENREGQFIGYRPQDYSGKKVKSMVLLDSLSTVVDEPPPDDG